MLTSRFRDPHRRLFFTKALLFPNRIELSGMALTGMYHRLLMLDGIDHVEWRAGQIKNANITFWMRDGSKMKLWMHSAGLWKYMVDANVRKLPYLLPQNAGSSS